ncbi:MAG: hypothetical protein EAX95_01820 [Candidatus Thorarchaeota archaeon]|nr:hypothetical protein [Candidatus Thorarchaeota archaeon]
MQRNQGPESVAGKCAVACFFMIWIGAVLGFGVFAVPSIPFPFALIPVGMAVIGFLVCVGVLASSSGRTRPVGVGAGYSISTTGDAMYADRGTSYSPRKRVVFQVPPKCPSCGAPLSAESVEWVGPLECQCPYCFATVEAKEREL